MEDHERAAWEDAYKAAHRTPRPSEEPGRGWFGTAGSIAAGLIALWALHAWAPS